MGQHGNPGLVTTKELAPPLGLKGQRKDGYLNPERVLEKRPPKEDQSVSQGILPVFGGSQGKKYPDLLLLLPLIHRLPLAEPNLKPEGKGVC